MSKKLFFIQWFITNWCTDQRAKTSHNGLVNSRKWLEADTTVITEETRRRVLRKLYRTFCIPQILMKSSLHPSSRSSPTPFTVKTIPTLKKKAFPTENLTDCSFLFYINKIPSKALFVFLSLVRLIQLVMHQMSIKLYAWFFVSRSKQTVTL